MTHLEITGGGVYAGYFPENYPASHLAFGYIFSGESLPSDPIGTTTVTFSGVNAGSEIRVYLPDGTELAGIETCSANQQLTWPVYAPGANSVVRIVIVNFNYELMEFSYTPVVGSQSIPIQQRTDRWASDPI